MPPDFAHELNYGKSGRIIAGIDEAGRGPWAGPVVAAAVIFAHDNDKIPAGIDDSKKLSPQRRKIVYQQIIAQTKWSVGIASVEEIDKLNILAATKLAMRRAVESLPLKPDVALVDGNSAPGLDCETITIIGGDRKSLSIAAASIIAKVTRDEIMHLLALEFPNYGWEKNSGYGTALHQKGLDEFGITPYHRRSFAPIRKLLTENLPVKFPIKENELEMN